MSADIIDLTPLSERPRIAAKDTSFCDRLKLEKETSKTEDEVSISLLFQIIEN